MAEDLCGYIEEFHNRSCRHSTLGYCLPVQFLKDWIVTRHEWRMAARCPTKLKPLRAVFLDSSFESDSTNINVAQIFKFLRLENEVESQVESL